MTTVRNHLAADLAPLLPMGWRIVRYESAIDNPDSVTVMLRYQGFEPWLNAGSALIHNLNLTLIHPASDNTEKAEDGLDEALEALMGALDQVPYVLVSRATKQVFADQFPCFDLELQLPVPIDS